MFTNIKIKGDSKMDKEFKKYGSIENHYRGKYIDRFTS